MQIATSGPEGTAAFHEDANGRAQQPFATHPPGSQGPGGGRSEQAAAAVGAASPGCPSPAPRAAVRAGSALRRCPKGGGGGVEGAGRRPRSPPGPGRAWGAGWGGSPVLLVAVGIWRRGRLRWRGGEARRRWWLRGRGGGGGRTAHAWPRRAPRPPPGARGLRTRQSSSARRIQARKSGSLTEPAFPLTQPQPQLIHSSEGKEAN